MYVCLFVCPPYPPRVLNAASSNMGMGTRVLIKKKFFFNLFNNFFLYRPFFSNESVKMADAKISAGRR